jgi:hypothetical protein
MKSTKFQLGVVMTSLLIGLSAASVHANEVSKTRDQVRAELKEALARGEVYISEVDYPKTPVTTSTKTREQVRAQVQQAKAEGTLFLVNDIDYPPAPVATGPGRSRAEVVAEVMEAKRNGTLQIDEVHFPDNRKARATVMTAKVKSAVETANADNVLVPATSQN